MYVYGGLNWVFSDVPSTVRFNLAFLVLTALVSLGTVLHGGRHAAYTRWVIWSATLLLALLLPFAAFTMTGLVGSDVMSLAIPRLPFMAGTKEDALVLGPGLSVGLAMLASVAARSRLAGAGLAVKAKKAHDEDDGKDTTTEGVAASSTVDSANTGSSLQARPLAERVGMFAGVAAFVVALLTWGIALFAPLYYRDSFQPCGICPLIPAGHVSLVEAVGGLVPLVRGTPFDCLLILAVLLLAGFVALGAYAHGRFGRPAFGRWLVWGAVIGLLLIVAAMTTLAFPEDNVVVLMRVTTFDLIFPWRNAFIAGPNLLSLILGPSLFGGLAVVAAIATGSSSAGAKARSAVNSTREQLELGQGETAVESSTTQT